MHFCYRIVVFYCIFFQHKITIKAEIPKDDVKVLLSEMMMEISELRAQMAQLQADMVKIPIQSHKMDLKIRIESMEAELEKIRQIKKKVQPSATVNKSKDKVMDKITDKINQLEARIEDNTLQITTMADNTDTLSTCRNVTANTTCDACASGPCPRGSTCLNVNTDGFICLCQGGTFGPTCSESFADTTFLVTSSSVLIAKRGSPIVFDEARINSGSNYDTTTGLYRVPVSGIYMFTVHLTSNGYDHITYYLSADGEPVAYTDMYNYHDTSFTLEKSLTLTLNAHQTVSVVPASDLGLYGSADGVMWSYFTGHLIYPLNTPDPKSHKTSGDRERGSN